ncbi:MAG: bifunctional diaminohydroxyphosphoribosylaminopyrimidine deaminase/5-amino-6-(5-phosphoribosylamino)uracil reductase RibD [Aquisalimonadaceae bacterium]
MTAQRFTAAEHAWMARALELARKGLWTTRPNPRVGCVLVRDGRIVGEGWHARAGEPHAEIHALRAAGADARGATAFVTLEPCSHHGRTPPCADALLEAGVSGVVAAMEDPNPKVAGQGLARLAAAGMNARSGLLAEQAEAVNVGFVSRMRRGRPWVRVKLAASLDGRTAMASGESRWITGDDARRDVHRLRAGSCAIVTGIGTVLADDPSLSVRDVAEADQVPPPLRVVLDSGLKMPAAAAMFALPGSIVVVTASEDAERVHALERAGAEVVRVGSGAAGGVDLNAVLALLAAREINDVLVEAGPVLAGAMLQAGLADELVLYQAPLFIGDAARPLVHLPGLDRLAQGIGLELIDVRRIGRDLRLTARPAERGAGPEGEH